MPASDSTVRPPVPNFLTIDVEEYFHVNYPGCNTAHLHHTRTNVEHLLDRLLSLCADGGIRCTFFVLGVMGEKYPNIVRKIHTAGHEVASHGYGHQELRGMAENEFRQDLQRSCGVLEQLTGERVAGYRAPSFSVTGDMLDWFYAALEDRGLTYSSSVFPGRTFLYGIDGFRESPHRPIQQGRGSSLLEIPITAFAVCGRRFPLYVRLLTAGALQRQLRAANEQGRPGVLYIHPREIDPTQPRLPLSQGQAFIHYWGVRGCETKLRRLMQKDLRFCTMRDYAERLRTE